jgi:hypothetical protein
MGNHDEIGKALVSVNGLLDPRPVVIMEGSRNARGTLKFTNVKRYIKHSFTDYIQAGLQLMLIIAIDFTASNQQQQVPSSLHYLTEHQKSTYETALEEVSRILLDYDYDKMVPVYGFGAKCNLPTFNSMGKVNHCFPLNGDENNAHVFMV